MRLGVFVGSVGLALVVSGLLLDAPALRFAIIAHFVACMVGMAIPARHYQQGTRIGVLALDIVIIATTGYLAMTPQADRLAVMMPFLAAFVVSTLVALVGRGGVSAMLGGMAGVMVLGMGLVFMQHAEGVPAAGFVLPQIGWIALATLQTAVVSNWMGRRDEWELVTKRVERELRAREAEAAEMGPLSEALVDASDVEDLAEAVLRHIRCHVPVRARAVVLDAEGDEVAIWEESGRLEQDHIERRRVLLQQGLARSGSSFVIRRLDARSVAVKDLPQKLDFHTAVDIPVRLGGRVAGVIYVADPERGALTPDRIGSLADVARRLGEALQRIERRRLSENRRTSMLMQKMREGVLLLAPDGTVLLANPAARRALMASQVGEEDERIGELSLEELGRTPPGINRRFRVQVPEHGDTPAREFACSAVSIQDGGQRIGTLVTLSDVTEEELARRRLMRAEKSTLVGQTLAGVAHELNNPLAALLGYADLLRAHDVPANIERGVQRMCEQATRATRIVRNLLNFARRRNPERVPTSIEALTDSTIELFAYEARMADIELVAEMPRDMPRILADKHALQQILVNLTQNALHSLKGYEGKRKITISVRVDEEWLTLYVRDTGPGVPQELRARIFQPFFTTKGSAQGTGLGLAISISIARDHGGDLLLEPDSGQGACFVLRLPIRAVQHETLATPDRLAGENGFIPASVLVVDDEMSVRETLVAQLGNMGSRVDSAGSSSEAEKLLLTQRYDVVLLDVHMPGASGIDLHRTVLEADPNLARRIVFMTGDFVNDDVLGDVLQTGNRVLEKPFTMDELKEAFFHAQGAIETLPDGGNDPAGGEGAPAPSKTISS